MNYAKQYQARLRRFVLAVMLILAACSITLSAQIFSEIYQFTDLYSYTSLTNTLAIDAAGRLYGTIPYGQPQTCAWDGEVFQLRQAGTGWILNPLYCFQGGDDGYEPYDYGGLKFGSDGALYGTTAGGGTSGVCSGGCGTVFRLGPPPNPCHTATCSWKLTTAYDFGPGGNSATPTGGVIFNSTGSMFGTAVSAFELTSSNGNWIYSSLYILQNGPYPVASLVMDRDGNLYGTNANAGSYGEVFQLTRAETGWVKTTLHTFINGQDGGSPIAGLAVDQDGNLYGATIHGGQNFGGVVYELSHSGGGWEFNAIYSLSGNGGPWSGLTLDDAGNLYGATCFDGHYQLGNVFELSPGQNGWIYSDLHSFSEADHASCPIAGVTVAPDGTLYGTASDIVWKIAR